MIGSSILAKSLPFKFAFIKLSLNADTSFHVSAHPSIANPAETDNGSWAELNITVSAGRIMKVKIIEVAVDILKVQNVSCLHVCTSEMCRVCGVAIILWLRNLRSWLIIRYYVYCICKKTSLFRFSKVAFSSNFPIWITTWRLQMIMKQLLNRQCPPLCQSLPIILV